MTTARRPVPPALAGLTGYLLRCAHQWAEESALGVLPAGWHPRDFAAFATLDTDGADSGDGDGAGAGEPRSQQDLADRLGINRTVMVKLADRWEQHGLVARRRNPADRRSYVLELTGGGRARLAAMRPRLDVAEGQMTAGLSAAERDRLVELLQSLRTPAGRAPAPPPALACRPGFLLSQAHLLAHELNARHLAPLNMTPRHIGWLSVLADREPCSQQEVARDLGVSGTVAVEMVDDMQERGFLERGADPMDRRRHMLRLTPAGRAALQRVRAAASEANNQLVEPLGPEGPAELNRLLRTLLDNRGPSPARG